MDRDPKGEDALAKPSFVASNEIIERAQRQRFRQHKIFMRKPYHPRLPFLSELVGVRCERLNHFPQNLVFPPLSQVRVPPNERKSGRRRPVHHYVYLT